MLRHEIFCCELKWIGEKDDGREIDTYDNNSTLLGVLDEKDVLISVGQLIFSQQPLFEHFFIETRNQPDPSG